MRHARERILFASRGRASVSALARINARHIVGPFGAIRVAIGVAFAFTPARFGGRSNGTPNDILMTRSFAVREAVLGAGGLLAVSRSSTGTSHR